MELEAGQGMPDLSDVSLEELARSDRSEIRHALEVALDRRAAVGIIFAGHSGSPA